LEKCSPRICDSSEIKKKLPKENSRPIVENSPNLVTLLPSIFSGTFCSYPDERPRAKKIKIILPPIQNAEAVEAVESAAGLDRPMTDHDVPR
jgi:hypothetical protein